MSSLDLLEAEIVPKLRTMGSYCHGCYFCGCGSDLVVAGGVLVVGRGRVCGDWGGCLQWCEFKEVSRTSSQKNTTKGNKPALFVPQRSMVFADGLEIKFFPILIF